MDTNEPMGDTASSPENDTQKVSPLDARKAAIREAERIKDVRARLYARGETLIRTPRHGVPPQIVRPAPQESVPQLSIEEKLEEPPATDSSTSSATALQNAVSYTATMAHKRTFRKTIAYIAVGFFVIATAVASFIMFTGNNTISGDNITLAVTGPNLNGAGEVLPFKVTISNQNVVPIQSATLIIEYPQGTQDTTDGKEITIERKPLDLIDKGETVTVELGARMFGSENEEKDIKVSIEYRITGSGGTFKKSAEPFHFMIGTAPVILSINALKAITAGQEYVLPLTVQSNSNIPLTNVLIRMSYPEGFNFSGATPNPSSGEDTWRIETLNPGEKKVITIKGSITGAEKESFKFNASAGIADATNKNSFTSTLTQTQSEVTIERPFLDAKIKVTGSDGEVSIIEKGNSVTVQVLLENTLDSVVYDGKVSLEIQGNTLDEYSVDADNGYYDSVANTITWDSTDSESLKEIIPGNPVALSFRLKLTENITSPTITFIATTQGQRIFEDKVPEIVEGSSKKVLKVLGTSSIVVKPLKDTGPFENSGPTPPVAEVTTQYTLNLSAKAGSNNLSNTEVVAELPQYVKWLDLVTEGDMVSYNPNTRMIKWTIGNMPAYSTQDVSFQISITPSKSQVGTSPNLIEKIGLTAKDDFTKSVIKSEGRAVTTSLDGGYVSGRVVAQ